MADGHAVCEADAEFIGQKKPAEQLAQVDEFDELNVPAEQLEHTEAEAKL